MKNIIDDFIALLKKHGLETAKEDVNVSVSAPEKIEDDGHTAVFKRTLTIEVSQYTTKKIINKDGWIDYV